MDVETFQRLILTARNVAVSHPSNLVRFAECGPFYGDSENTANASSDKAKTEERRKFILRLVRLLKILVDLDLLNVDLILDQLFLAASCKLPT
jgi:hypothetical protein